VGFDFDVPIHGEHVFPPNDDKDRLMVLDKDHMFRDAMKQIGQAFAMGCLAVSKARSWKSAED